MKSIWHYPAQDVLIRAGLTQLELERLAEATGSRLIICFAPRTATKPTIK